MTNQANLLNLYLKLLLDNIKVPPPKNFLASSFKELHLRLLHLTWQAQQVASGNYSQRVDFMDEFSSKAFNSMVVTVHIPPRPVVAF